MAQTYTYGPARGVPGIFELRGHDSVTVRDADGTAETSAFYTSGAQNGKTAGDVDLLKGLRYRLERPEGVTRWTDWGSVATGGGATFVRPDATREVRGAQSRRTRTWYDGWGNVIDRREYGDATAADGAYLRRTGTEFVTPARGLPSRALVSGPGDALVGETRFLYDGASSHTAAVTGHGLLTAQRQVLDATRDGLGRPTEVTLPGGQVTRTRYDGWHTEAVDANGHKRRQEQDGLGRSVTLQEYSGTFTGGEPPSQGLYATTTYGYDPLDRLTGVTDAAGTQTRITYDQLGRKVQMQDPDMGAWQYTYDALGLLTSQTDALGQRIDFAYDLLKRPVRTWYPIVWNDPAPTRPTVFDLMELRAAVDTDRAARRASPSSLRQRELAGCTTQARAGACATAVAPWRHR